MKKKLFLIGLLLFIFLTTRNVNAMSLGIATMEEYNGASVAGEEESITTKSGGRGTVVLNFSSYWGDNDSLASISVHITPNNGISVANASILTEDAGNTISGQGNDYNIAVGGQDKSGTALFQLQLPSPNVFTVATANVTAKAYDAMGGELSSTQINAHFNILVPLTYCDSNSDASMTTSIGTPQKIGEFFGENFALTTTSSNMNITITPASRKSKIYYAKDGVFGDNNEFLADGKLNNKELNYGDNEMSFLIYSECFEEWNRVAEATSGAPLVGISFEEYQEYQVSPNALNLVVTREDNRSKVNTLSSLTISDVKINFKPDLKTYIATVPNKVKSVKVTSTLTDSKSSYVNGFGNRTVNLNEGDNEILIKVTAENGGEAVYTIKITREKSDNAKLKKLVVNKKEIKLKEDTLLYTVNVENDVTKAEVEAVAEEESAKVEIGEIKELQEGNNRITITVIAANGTKKVYNVNVVRDKAVSENSKLKDLIIKNHPIDFDSYLYEYTVTISKDEKTLDIEVIPENKKSNFYIIGNKNLENGSTVKIKVTAEDGKTVTNYIINIEQENNNSILKYIIIGVISLVIVGIIVVLINSKKNKKTYATLDEKKEESPKVENQKEEIEELDPVDENVQETGEESHE